MLFALLLLQILAFASSDLIQCEGFHSLNLNQTLQLVNGQMAPLQSCFFSVQVAKYSELLVNATNLGEGDTFVTFDSNSDLFFFVNATEASFRAPGSLSYGGDHFSTDLYFPAPMTYVYIETLTTTQFYLDVTLKPVNYPTNPGPVVTVTFGYLTDLIRENVEKAAANQNLISQRSALGTIPITAIPSGAASRLSRAHRAEKTALSAAVENYISKAMKRVRQQKL